jgi:cytochrome P450
VATSQTATRAPSAASRRQVAAPIPLAPPVTSAVRPSSLMSGQTNRPDFPAGFRAGVTALTHGASPLSKFLLMSLPPGPKTPAPIQMAEWIMRPIPFLERCTRRYGDFFTVRFVFGDIVWIADPHAIKTVFTGDPDVLHAGEANAPPLEPIMGRNSVLLLDEPEHMRQRKLMLPSFHGERMQRYAELIADITERDIDGWPVGTPFGLRARTQEITLEVIMRAVFGIQEAERLERLRGSLSPMLDLGTNPQAMIGIAFPFMRRTLGKRVWDRFLRLRDEADALIFDEIHRRREDPSTPERDDVLSILLQARDDEGKPMTDAELRDELMTLLVAGHETTATSIAWAFDLLLHNPGKLARLKDDLARGEEEYLDAVIKETLRIRPVVPGVVRKLTRPFELRGYELPPGTRLAPNIYLTHHNPAVYPEPERFLPERFLDNGADTYSWIPFGGGIRRCLGASFALYEMKVAIPTILRRVEIEAAGPSEPIRRRAITFAPERDAMVLVNAKHPAARATPVTA